MKKELKECVETALQNPNLSVQEKDVLLRMQTDVEMANIEMLSARIKSVNADVIGR